MWGQPGKKLLFMGGELGQWSEWAHDGELDWELLREAPHRGVNRWVEDLNELLVSEAALHQRDFDPGGFSWVDPDNSARSLVSFLRFDAAGARL
jgi:1,4-alpha-glucan branching enzyme